MPGYFKRGTHLELACSCEVTVIMSLVLVGVHRHYTVRIARKGSRCHLAHHRVGQRTVVRQSRSSRGSILRDLLQ